MSAVKSAAESSIQHRIAEEIGAQLRQVDAAVRLLDEGATVPFIARYRKEVTGGLDDTQLRNLAERLEYLRDMEKRRATILESIEEQGLLTDDLKKSILEADTKTRLEDLYLPFKPKRRTKAQIAREAGLEPLADALLEAPGGSLQDLAAPYISEKAGIESADQALEGARHILIESFSENADLVGSLRDRLWKNGEIVARVATGKEKEGAKFRDYFDHHEAIEKIPSHRLLALFRARNEGILYLDLDLPNLAEDAEHPCIGTIRHAYNITDGETESEQWLCATARMAWKSKIHLHLTLDLFGRAREAAEDEAISVFSKNLKDLMLQPPAGRRSTMALDPGLRTGVKVAIVDNTGKVVQTGTIFPHAPRNDWQGAMAQLAAWTMQYGVELVAIGNGTASRETEKLVDDMIKAKPDLRLTRVLVSEAGASVYSASEIAAREFPSMDVSLRGAVSIARRLQDPLAELVKIDPKSIGVGQYQHDVNQVKLARSLDARVEDCVNAVGVELNTASAPLLARVSGLNPSVAENIVRRREEKGPFKTRTELLAIPRLGDKTFEQAAGFLRIKQGSNPLDASGVHPESYPVVERILAQLDKPLGEVLGNSALLGRLNPADFTCDSFGEPTVRDILAELDKPGRDPRGEFKTARFAEGVHAISDLKEGMVLEGVVSNVTNFGAFVDIGVHQDGLVHISQLSDNYVEDPRKVVKAGDVVKVRVTEVDEPRKRIGLTMKLAEPAQKAGAQKPAKPRREKPRGGKPGGKPAPNKQKGRSRGNPGGGMGALGEALAAAMKNKK